MAIPNIFDRDDCLGKCKSNPSCKWTTFDTQSSLCHLNGACYHVADGTLLKYHNYARRDCGLQGKCLIPLGKHYPGLDQGHR